MRSIRTPILLNVIIERKHQVAVATCQTQLFREGYERPSFCICVPTMFERRNFWLADGAGSLAMAKERGSAFFHISESYIVNDPCGNGVPFER